MSNSIYFRNGYILFIGYLPDLPLHSHITVSFCTGVEKSLEIKGKGIPNWTRFQSAFIPTGAEHEIKINGNRFATLLAEPGTNLAELIIKNSTKDRIKNSSLILNPSFGDDFHTLILNLESAKKTNSEIDLEFQRLIPEQTLEAKKIDPRLLEIGNLLISSKEETIPLETLGTNIQMSDSWIMHNFKSQFGIPIRKFRNWYRMKRVAMYLKQGESFSQAAIGAGFYDQAHFNGVFREFFGIQPGFIFQRQKKINWYIQEETYFSEFVNTKS